MMENRPQDIAPAERRVLSSLKKRPGMYLGTKSFKAFVAWMHGYTHALSTAKIPPEQHNLLPDGMHEFAAKKYLGDEDYVGPLGWMSFIEMHVEHDDKKALDEFFSFLDEYLEFLGFEPVPDWDEEHKKFYAETFGE